MLEEVTQSGRWIVVPARHFGPQQPTFRTREYTQIQIGSNNQLPFYRGLGYRVEIRQILNIRTLDLPPNSRHLITFVCPACGESTSRRVIYISYNPLCEACGQAKASAVQQRNSDQIRQIEQDYEIKILEYGAGPRVSRIRKLCGCIVEQQLANLLIRGVKSCKCDGQHAWKTLQIWLCAELGGRERSLECGRPDCVTSKSIFEIKANLNAALGKRHSATYENQIRKYRSWALKHEFAFNVLVNEPDHRLEANSLPDFFLGWESWKKVGISNKLIKRCKDLKRHPEKYRKRQLAKRDLELIEAYKKLSIRLGHLPSKAECRENLPQSIDVIKNRVCGTHLATQAELGHALGLKGIPVGGHDLTASKRAYKYKFQGKIYTAYQICKIIGVEKRWLENQFRKQGKPDSLKLPRGNVVGRSTKNPIRKKFRGLRVARLDG